MIMKMVMIIIQTISTFVSNFWFWCRKKIFNHRATSYTFEIWFKRISTKNRLSCTRRNRNFRSENWCVNDDIICIYKLNIGANQWKCELLNDSYLSIWSGIKFGSESLHFAAAFYQLCSLFPIVVVINPFFKPKIIFFSIFYWEKEKQLCQDKDHSICIESRKRNLALELVLKRTIIDLPKKCENTWKILNMYFQS